MSIKPTLHTLPYPSNVSVEVISHSSPSAFDFHTPSVVPQLRDVVGSLGNRSGNGCFLDDISIADNPVCLCSDVALRSLLTESVPSLKRFNDTDLSSSIPDDSVAAGASVGRVIPSTNADFRTLQRQHGGVAMRGPTSHVKRGNSAFQVFSQHNNCAVGSPTLKMSESCATAKSAHTEEDNFRGIFDEWMRKTILETVEGARLAEETHKA